ncbi:hypothetical protein N9B60_01055 [Mariniblastus sp.]|nr:hypothetical protein [Mariniblastus sp.]
MDLLEIVSLVSRWLHIIPAIALVGGTLFMRLSYVPATQECEASAELREAIRKKWAKIVMISIALLLVSGLYNSAVKSMGYDLSPLYNGLLGIKILLGFAIFYLASVLSGRSEKAKAFRQRELHWLNILCILMILTVMIASYMKMSSSTFPKKNKTTPTAHKTVAAPATTAINLNGSETLKAG